MTITSASYSIKTVKANFGAAGTTTGGAFGASVVGLDDGGYALAYNTDFNTDYPYNRIYREAYTSTGQAHQTIKTAFQVSSFTDETTTPVGDTTIFVNSGGKLSAAIASHNYIKQLTEGGTNYSGLSDPDGEGYGSINLSKFGANGASTIAVYEKGGAIYSMSTTAYGYTFNTPTDLSGGDGADPVVTFSESAEKAFIAYTHISQGHIDILTVDRDSAVQGVALEGADYSDQPDIASGSGTVAIAYRYNGDVSDPGGRIKLAVMYDGFTNPNSDVKTVDVTYADGHNDHDPVVAVLSNGYVMVQWTHDLDATNEEFPFLGSEIRYRIFTSGGNPVIIDGSTGYRTFNGSQLDGDSALAAMNGGRFISVVEDGNTPGDPSASGLTGNIADLVYTQIDDDDETQIYSTATADVVKANGGNDTVFGSEGHDTLDGGAQTDKLSYRYVEDGLKIQLSSSSDSTVRYVATGELKDKFKNFEVVEGSKSGDMIYGDSRGNTINGRESTDLIQGFAGKDTLDGGDDGQNILSYRELGSDKGIDLTLAGATYAKVKVGGVEEDSVRNFTEVWGGAGKDIVRAQTSHDTANRVSFDGYDGNDTFRAGYGSNTAIGGLGSDTIVLNTFGTAGIAMSLEDAAGQGGNIIQIEDIMQVIYIGFESATTGAGNDSISGSGAKNTIKSGDGNDTIVASNGNDSFDGGKGTDTVDYSRMTSKVTVVLDNSGNGSAKIGTKTDTLTGIERVKGGSAGDSFTGGSAANKFYGNGGNDTFKGGAGNDALSGGSDVDTASYADRTTKVVVVLDNSGNGTAKIGSETDTLTSIENITGGSAGDSITGGSAKNSFSGGDGADTFKGGGGNDTLKGGSSSDTADYSDKTAKVTVVLNADGDGTAKTGSESDTLDSIERIIGGSAGDSIAGGGAANVFYGRDGADTLLGGSGADTLIGGSGKDSLSGGADADRFDFVKGDSGIKTSTVDVITDWTTADSINTAIAGTSGNYFESSVGSSIDTIEEAAVFAEGHTSASIRHAFLFNASKDVGFLLMDLDSNGAFETGVILKGAGSASEFSFSDLV